MIKLIHTKLFFYLLFSLAIFIITLSNPFLRVPYDMWYHLERIDYYTLHHISLWDVHNKELWPYLWGTFFTVIPIENFLLKTKIIHVSQALISFFIIYFTSKVFIRNIFKQIDLLHVQYLSLWSVFIWFTIFATFSVHYHQVWILWYSINYQITLLFFWYIVALLLILFEEESKPFTILIYQIQIILFSVIILWMHASEFIYIGMYLVLFSFIYCKQIYTFYKNNFIPVTVITIVTIGIFIYFITGGYIYKKPPLFHYLTMENIHLLDDQIIILGTKVVRYFSRAFASMNELIYVSLLFSTLMSAIFLYKRNSTNINLKVYLLLLISTLFVFVPTTVISSGIASLLFGPTYINRFYYASTIFLILPISVYFMIPRKNIWLTNLLIAILLLSTLIYSKYISSNHNYYKNITSIKESLIDKNIGFNLSSIQINTIGKKLKEYERENNSSKENYYYARDDIALAIKFIYNKPALWKHRGNKDYIKSYHDANNSTYHPVLFNVPIDFPIYERYK